MAQRHIEVSSRDRLPQESLSDKQRLQGTWKLISSVGVYSDGRVIHPYGEKPEGLLVYDPHGNFIAQIQGQGRPLFESGNLLRGAPEEIKAAFEGYVAYYGKYEVDEDAASLTHYVEGSLFPNWVGSTQTRFYSFEDERLVLTTPPFVGKKNSIIHTLVWEAVN
jgi:hypothetical protein